jgi:hypothetical protein
VGEGAKAAFLPSSRRSPGTRGGTSVMRMGGEFLVGPEPAPVRQEARRRAGRHRRRSRSSSDNGATRGRRPPRRLADALTQGRSDARAAFRSGWRTRTARIRPVDRRGPRRDDTRQPRVVQGAPDAARGEDAGAETLVAALPAAPAERDLPRPCPRTADRVSRADRSRPRAAVSGIGILGVELASRPRRPPAPGGKPSRTPLGGLPSRVHARGAGPGRTTCLPPVLHHRRPTVPGDAPARSASSAARVHPPGRALGPVWPGTPRGPVRSSALPRRQPGSSPAVCRRRRLPRGRPSGSTIAEFFPRPGHCHLPSGSSTASPLISPAATTSVDAEAERGQQNRPRRGGRATKSGAITRVCCRREVVDRLRGRGPRRPPPSIPAAPGSRARS